MTDDQPGLDPRATNVPLRRWGAGGDSAPPDGHTPDWAVVDELDPRGEPYPRLSANTDSGVLLPDATFPLLDRPDLVEAPPAPRSGGVESANREPGSSAAGPDPRSGVRAFPRHLTVLVADLVPYARNARTHTEAEIDQVVASIREFGWTSPILVDGENGIIAGHRRVLAAAKLGLVEVPAILIDHLSEVQRRALALNAGWDEKLLGSELAALELDGFDLGLVGFGGEELASLFALNAPRLTDPDDAPPAPERPVSALGDVWLLGGHRIVCGDSTDALVVERLLRGAKPHLMVTDPPWGVEYAPGWRSLRLADGAHRAEGRVKNDSQADWRRAWALFPGSVAYVWHAGAMVARVAISLEACRFAVRAQIVWVKTRHVIGRGDYHQQHEPAFYAVREGATEEEEGWGFVPEHEIATYAVAKGQPGKYHGGRKQSTVWFIEHVKSETGHGTQKPVMCMQRPIENNSRAGQAIYEPFSGSGTTIIAAEITGRLCYAAELSEAYCDVAVLRWQAFTGRVATLEADGRTFAQVEEARLAT